MEQSETVPQPEIQNPVSDSHFCCSLPNCKCNWLLYCLAAFLILIIPSGVAYLYSTRNQPPVPVSVATKTTPIPITNLTTNWKVYTNNQYLYEFKYPSAWFHYNDSEDNPPTFYSEDVRAPLEMSNNGTSLVIYQGKYAGKDTSTKKVTYQVGNNNIVKSWHTPIPNLPTEQGYSLNYQVTNNGSTTLQFNFLSFSEKTIQNNEQLFDQILSTFRFLDQLPPTVNP